MIVNDILTLARDLTNSSADMTGLQDSQLIRIANIAYHAIENRIIAEMDEGYFMGEYLADIVASQNRYQLPVSTPNASGVKKIRSVEIKWTTTQPYYSPTEQIRTEQMQRASDAMKVAGVRYYDIRNDNVDIFPSPTESVTNGLKVRYIMNLIDLGVGGAETTVFPGHSELRQYHHLIALGIVPYIYLMKGKLNEKNDATKDFERQIQVMIEGIKARNYGPQIQGENFYPNLTD